MLQRLAHAALIPLLHELLEHEIHPEEHTLGTSGEFLDKLCTQLG
jgi:hypothetical protein